MGGRPLARFVLDALVAERAQIQVRHQVLAVAEQHGRDGRVELVDEPRTQIFPVPATSLALASAASIPSVMK